MGGKKNAKPKIKITIEDTDAACKPVDDTCGKTADDDDSACRVSINQRQIDKYVTFVVLCIYSLFVFKITVI